MMSSYKEMRKMRKCMWLVSILMTLFLQLHVVSSSYNASATTHLSPNMQKLALFQFKLSLAINTSASSEFCFDSHPRTMNWSMSSDCCTWDGVTCDQMTGDVIGLDLSCSQLVGSIAPNSTLFQLTLLQFISFDFIDLHGVLPEEIFHLPNLKQLSLLFNSNLTVSLPKVKWGSSSTLQKLSIGSGDSLYGGIPDSIGYLESLTSLILMECNILGPIPRSIRNLTQLTDLNLSYNLLSGPIPRFISNLTQLTHLDLTSNLLSGPIPDSLVYLQNLDLLSLASNNFFGPIPRSIGNLTQLTQLNLGSNNLSGPIPDSLANLKNLVFLSLAGLTLSGGIPDSIGYLESLTYLFLFNCSLSGPIPRSISNLTQLTDLYLGFNHLSGPIPDSLANLQNLEQLSLGFNNLTGEFPYWVANLRQLGSLDLSSNSLNGPLPSNLTALCLPKLTTLTLSYNSLNGTIPSWLFDLPSLTDLSIDDNGFTGHEFHSSRSSVQSFSCRNNLLNGTIPQSWLVNLRKLFIDGNRFTGQLNEFHSSVLTDFSCSNNSLNGTIPQSFSQLVNLTGLDFSSNNFSGVLDIETFSHLQYLKNLDFSHNSLSLRFTSTTKLPPNLFSLGLSSCNVRKFPHFVRSLENLEQLDLSNNQIDGEIPWWFESIGSYAVYHLYLNLSHNSLTGGLQHLPWNNLRFLDLSNNQIQGEIPHWTGGLEYLPLNNNLQYLDLHSNLLNGSLSASICNSTSLQVLNLSHNNLSGILPTCPTNLNYSLFVFDLRINSITGSLPSALSNFHKLKSLNLHGNKLQGTIPPSFAEFDYLEVLDLGSNHLKDIFPRWLEALQNLQVLILKSNKFHGIINNLSKIKHPFPKLRIIDLSDNEFSGPLPKTYIENFKAMMNVDVDKIERSYMGNSFYSDTMTVVIKGVEVKYDRILTVLTTIDLSINKFEGEIPVYIGNLASLRYLNLSHNHLSGHIPSSIGKLSMLESLDLSVNRLVGVIPEQLTSLYFLSLLNVSQNDLSGPIPQGAQFNTFENYSYAGNSGLCGRPLSKTCQSKIVETQQEEEENKEDDDDGYFFSGLTWEAVAVGYGGGVVLGFVAGYMMFMVGKPKWFTGIIARELGLKVRRLEIRRR